MDQSSSARSLRRLPKLEQQIAAVIASASTDVLETALDGTVGDALNFARAAARQYERRVPLFADGYEAGQHAAEAHALLLLAHEAVCHAARVEQLLAALGRGRPLPPDHETRERLRVARNLLAEHRDERVLYWRLTGQHTERVQADYSRLGVVLPNGSIDSETFDDQSVLGDRWGTVGGLLSLPDLALKLDELIAELENLIAPAVAAEAPDAERGATVTLRFEVVGPITTVTS